MMTGFETAAFKLLISDMKKARDLGDGVWELQISAASLGCSRSNIKKELKIKLVWIQLTIIDSDDNAIIIKDDTGDARILSVRTVPGGDHSGVKIGSYIGVMGQLESISPTIVITAVKIMCLEDKPLLKKMWPDEVKTLKAYLIDLLIPGNI